MAEAANPPQDGAKKDMKTKSEAVELVDVKQRLSIGKSKMKAKFFNDDEWKKLREKHEVPSNFLELFDMDDLTEGGGKGGSLMARTKDGKYIVKEMSDGDHTSLLKLTDQLIEIMMAEDTLISAFYAHFSLNGKVFIAMTNCIPSGIKWTFLFDLKGCRDDKAMIMDGNKIRAVHKRCFDCFKCWYCCDLACCPCYPEDRALYCNGKAVAWSGLKLHMTDAQATKVKKLITKDAETLANLQTMDYSLLIAYLVLDQAKVEAGEISEDEKNLIKQSEYVSVYEGKVYVYYMGVIDFLQEWNCKKDIARCIKLCAPHPLSTTPPPNYAEQFKQLGEKVIADAKPLKLKTEQKKTEDDPIDTEAIEVKVDETPKESTDNPDTSKPTPAAAPAEPEPETTQPQPVADTDADGDADAGEEVPLNNDAAEQA